MNLPVPEIEPHSIDSELHFDKFATIMAYTTDFKVSDEWTQWHTIYDFETLTNEMFEDKEATKFYDVHTGPNVVIDHEPANFSNKMLF